MRGCLVASDVRVLRDVLVGVGREPAVLGITVAGIEMRCATLKDRANRAVRERAEMLDQRDEARRERDEARELAAKLKQGVDTWRESYCRADAALAEARVEAARYREALERITAAHVAGASAGELADRARGVLRGGGGA